MKLSLINKNKKAIFIELFAKYLEIDSKNAIIGSLIEIKEQGINKTEISRNQPATEFKKIIEYLVSIGKEQIADEIININELISFETKSEIQKINEKIKLTKREKEILKLICEGLTNHEIAEKLFISNRTVDNHRANLLSKTATKNTASLVAFAYKNHLMSI